TGEDDSRPILRQIHPGVISASHAGIGEYTFVCDVGAELLFTENETNTQRLWGQPNSIPHVKDAFHEYVINQRTEAVNPERTGTKAAAHYELEIEAGGSQALRLRLTNTHSKPFDTLIEPASFDRVVKKRIADADEFYDRITASSLSEEDHRI